MTATSVGDIMRVMPQYTSGVSSTTSAMIAPVNTDLTVSASNGVNIQFEEYPDQWFQRQYFTRITPAKVKLSNLRKKADQLRQELNATMDRISLMEDLGLEEIDSVELKVHAVLAISDSDSNIRDKVRAITDLIKHR